MSGRIVFDGFAGTRTDSFPSLSIANGAPTGADATDTQVLSWLDGPLNNERALVQTSVDHGVSWSSPVNAPAGGPPRQPGGGDLIQRHRPASGLHPQPFQRTTANPRNMQGVVRHADVSPAGAIGGFATLHRGAIGDARGFSANGLTSEFLGDYNYAFANREFAAAVWNDARAAAVCPAMNAFRQSLVDGNPIPAPAPNQDCPKVGRFFGNSDIFGGTYADPTTPLTIRP